MYLFCCLFHIASNGIFYSMSEFMARPNVWSVISNGNAMKHLYVFDEMKFEIMGMIYLNFRPVLTNINQWF